MPDSDSFDAFYAATVRRVICQLYALTGDKAEAEDVAQEAFARAWQRWDRVGRYADPEGWVRTVAYRISVSSWRKAVNRGRAHQRFSLPAPPEVNPDYVAVVEALRKISERQRRAVVLHHIVGLSVEEIAAQTGASLSAVKAQLSRGRRALSSLLAEPASVDPGQETLHA
jgi:RNA polymerase sigma-70 factor (ECF subfamily)